MYVVIGAVIAAAGFTLGFYAAKWGITVEWKEGDKL